MGATVSNLKRLWVVRGDDANAAGNYCGREQRRPELDGLRIQIQTWRFNEEAAFRRALPASARLADVVCGAGRPARRTLVSEFRSPALAKFTRCPRAFGPQSVSKDAA